MNGEEILELRDRAYIWLASHKKKHRWLLTQFRAAKRYSRQILDGDFKHGWPKLDDLMIRLSSLAPHHLDDMKRALITFKALPDFCAAIRGKIDRLEPIYKGMVDSWLDIKRSLAESPPPGSQGTLPEDAGGVEV